MTGQFQLNVGLDFLNQRDVPINLQKHLTINGVAQVVSDPLSIEKKIRIFQVFIFKLTFEPWVFLVRNF